MADLMKRLAAERDTGRMAFLAQKEQIREALSEGYRAKAIWRALQEEGAMPVGYESFLRYVRELPEYAAGAKRGAGEAEPKEAARPRRAAPAKKASASPFSLRNRPDAVKELMETDE